MERINFTVNGTKCSVGSEVSSDITLLDYIRNTLELRGTKYMCREAGCGACVVTAAKSPGAPKQAVNSCMVSITSCQNWEITTIEELGNRRKGYHLLQKTLAEHNGSQCGYCSPGWIMSMYGLLESRNNLTKLEIERSLGSNICRCTGYRPILDAFKSLATDAPTANKLKDIEDLYICNKTEAICKNIVCDDEENQWCFVTRNGTDKDFVPKITLKDGKVWYKARKVEDIFSVLQKNEDNPYMLVSGNTAKGAYPRSEYPEVLIDISQIADMKKYELDQNLVIGSGVTLTEFKDIFQDVSREDYFGYLKILDEHLQMVAHIPVRNLGTVGGNLMLKHEHKEFPSDIFLILETVDAELHVSEKMCAKYTGAKQLMKMQEFLNTDMRKRVILNVLLPPLNDEHKIVTFKILERNSVIITNANAIRQEMAFLFLDITTEARPRVKALKLLNVDYKVMSRSQHSSAIVNAGFRYQLTGNNIVKHCRIVYGGLSPQFTRAMATEAFLIGRRLFTNDTLQKALLILATELIVIEDPPKPSVEYRKQLALGLFYKGLLTLCPKNLVSARHLTGAIKIHETRSVSQGHQDYNTDPSLWPLTQPVKKVEGLIQCAGEALYTEDMPSIPHQVFAAFVLSTIAVGDIVSIDPSKALEKPGVLGFYSAEDIPGLNSFTPKDAELYSSDEEVFCSGTVKYYNQPIGVIAAETQALAEAASSLVYVKYANVKKPVLNIKEALNHPDRITMYTHIDAMDKGNDVVKIIKSSNSTFAQYHFMMENMVCIVQPSEQGLKVNAASQWIDAMQLMISRALKIEQNRIDINTIRLGGSYGIKISRCIQSAVACSLIARTLNRPCRFILPLTTNMRAVGKRLPCHTNFEVGVNSLGVIQNIDYDVYADNGYKLNEQFNQIGPVIYNNCYDKSRWNYRQFDVKTDTPKNTWCRGPITLENVAMAEYIMEQISYELSLDPLEVRLANIAEEYKELKPMIQNLKNNSDYDQRREAANKFNSDNRWSKRGLRISVMRWTPFPLGRLDVNMSVYHGDGTVVITHGGIEMGQGLNTIAIQICAYLLNISMDKILVKENNTVISPNAYITAAAVTSQNINIAVQKCCEDLLERLEPIKKRMGSPIWEDLIQEAFNSNVDLQTHGFVSPEDPAKYPYAVYGVALAEVQIDVLTGESEILRVDLEEDVGQSISPEIDIGQVEGAFIMGQGYWTSEELVFDDNTGELLTNRTWNYKVPVATDIPQDFRIYFRKNSYSFKNIFGAKVVGEPPICLSVVIALALREAISSARREAGIPTTQWFPIEGPYTVEKIGLATATNIKDFKFT